MPEIASFRGFFFNPQRVSLEETVLRLESLVHYQREEGIREDDNRLLAKLAISVLREPHKTRNLIETWRKDGILVQDEKPTVYVYHQVFEHEGTTRVRKGWIAPCLLEPFEKGRIFPHESTFSWGTERHLRFIRAAKMNFAPVLVLYSDPERRIDFLLEPETQKKPLFEVRDEMDSTHLLWRIESDKILRFLYEIMLDRPLVIADGHHRYESSLLYMEETRRKKKNIHGMEAFLYRLMAFTNVYDDGVVILPTHRLVLPTKKPDWETFFSKLKGEFRVRSIGIEEGLETLHALGEHSFGLYRGGSSMEILTLKKDAYLDYFGELCGGDTRSLDVVILHRHLLERLLGITHEDKIVYLRHPQEGIERLKKGMNGFLFLLNPPSPVQVFELAKSGHRMPPKSTDFYPKLVTGLVMMDIVDGEVVYPLGSQYENY